MLLKKVTNFKFLIVFLALLFLIVPEIADGWAFDLATNQLSALSEKTGPLIAVFLYAFLFFIIGYAALWITSTLLQSAIDATPEALTVMGGDAAEIVQVGWNFTVGIGNMLLVFAFVIVALATILGFENYHIKKLFPRLIIVALLMNFTLLFVGIGIDISNFLFNSISIHFAPEGGNIMLEALKPILDLGSKMVTSVGITLTGTVASLLVPYLNVGMQVLWVALFTTLLLPGLIQMATVGLIFWFLSGIFFSFFVVFISRIFIIQVLAILGPIAFFTLIFPKTEGLWKKWLNYLIQWLSVGVVFIFLMYIGLLFAPLAGSLLIFERPSWMPNFIWDYINIVPHIILAIYFFVIAKISKSIIPDLAKAIIAQAGSLAKMAVPYVGAIGKAGAKKMQHGLADHAGFQKTMAKWESTPPPGSPGPFKSSSLYHHAKRSLGGLGAATKEAKKKSIDEAADKLKDATSTETSNAFRDAHLRNSQTDKLGALLAAHKNDNLEDLVNKNNDIIGDQNNFDKMFDEAEKAGKKKDFIKALPAQYLERETAGKTNTQKEQIVREFVETNAKGDDMKKMAPKIIEALNSANTTHQEVGKRMVKAMTESRDLSYLKNFGAGAKGADGIKAIKAELDVQVYNVLKRNPTSSKERNDTIRNHINPALAENKGLYNQFT